MHTDELPVLLVKDPASLRSDGWILHGCPGRDEEFMVVRLQHLIGVVL